MIALGISLLMSTFARNTGANSIRLKRTTVKVLNFSSYRYFCSLNAF